MQEKKCADCSLYFEINSSNFYLQKRNSKRKGEYLYCPPTCKECTKTRNLNYSRANPEKMKLWHRKTNERPERQRALKENSELRRRNGRHLQWQRNNPDKTKQYNEQHRTHEISEEEWIRCKEYFAEESGEWSCAYCGFLHKYHTKRRLGKIHKQDLHKEHVVHDGANDLSNCIPACQRCNSSKHKKEMQEWYQQQPFFSLDRLEKINQWLNEDYIL